VTLGLIGVEILFLKHESQEAGSGLIFNFRDPVQKVAFSLRGAADVTAVMTAFDPSGSSLGSIQQTGLDPEESVFAGFETDHPQGVAKVVLDYQGSDETERVENLFFTYSERPRFSTYLAQIADGKVGANALKTTIVIANLANTTANAEIRIFGDDGSPLELELEGGGEISSKVVQVEPFASTRFVTSGNTSPPIQGYVCIESDVPMAGTAIFQFVDASGVPLSEAGVGGSTASYNLVGAVSKEVARSFDSGVAVINLGDEPAAGVIELVSSAGSIEARNTEFLELGPGEHAAGFLDQLFPLLFGRDFGGSLLIRSEQPLVVVILRTAKGIVLSSLPVGTTQR
jgi:hypothetical protein